MTTRGSTRPEENTPPGSLTWEYAFPLLTNPLVLWDILRWLAITIGLFYILMATMGWIAGEGPLWLPLQVPLAILAFLGFATLVTLLLVFQNRFPATFGVDGDRAWMQAGSKARTINRVFMAVALLSGRPGMVGSAMLTSASETGSIAWEDVRRLQVHRRQRAISLSDSWHTVVRLYCPPELFEEVARQVQARVAAAPRAEQRGTPWRSILRAGAWLALVGLATPFALAWQPEETVVAVLFGAGLTALAGLLPGRFGWAAALAGMVGVSAAAAQVAWLALEEHIVDERFVRWRGYEHDTAFLLITVAALAVLLAAAGLRLARARPSSSEE